MTDRKIRKIPVKKGSKFAIFLTILTIGAAIYLAGQVYFMQIFPIRLTGMMLGICVAIPLLFLLFHVLLSNKTFFRILFSLIIVCLGVVYGTGSYMLKRADQALDVVTELTTQRAHKINLISLHSSGISELSQINGKTIGASSSLDAEGTQKELEHLKDQVEVNVQEYETLVDLVNALVTGEVSAIVLNEVYRGDLIEIGGEEFNQINTASFLLDEVTYFTENDRQLVQPDRVRVSEQPFTVLVSGNDSYGTLNEVNRSDVNMLLTVNPKTATVLITNVSRDAYVPIACGADADATCAQGAMDKLTHTGLDGVATTEKTIEQMLGININYNVRINFSSFENIVNAVGGIDVFVEEGCDVETFYVNGTEGVKAGWNHLDGPRALGFVRERYAYLDGTTQRVRNQQEAIRALISKVCTPATIPNFNKIVDALNSAFETNMSTDEIKGFIRFQFSQFPEWKFEGYSLRYEPSTEYCTYLGNAAFVDIPYTDSIEIAKQKIEAVLKGKSSEEIEDPYEQGIAGSYDFADQEAIIHEGEIEQGTYVEEYEVYYEEPYQEEIYEY